MAEHARLGPAERREDGRDRPGEEPPPPLTPQAVLALAASGGNRALTRVLQRWAVSETPARLGQQLAEVEFTGEGVSGAFRLSNGSSNLWFKSARVPERQMFAEAVLEDVGVNTPHSRQIVDRTKDQMYDELEAAKRAKLLKGNVGRFDAAVTKGRDRRGAVLMHNAPGIHGKGTAKALKGGDTATADRFKEAFRTPLFAEAVGRMMAADQFLGIYDRLSQIPENKFMKRGGPKTHFENFYVDTKADLQRVGGAALTAIDNEAGFAHIAAKSIADVVKQAAEGQPIATDEGMAGVELMFDRATAQAVLELLVRNYDKSGVTGLGDPTQGGIAPKAFAALAIVGWEAAQKRIVQQLQTYKKQFRAMHSGLTDDHSFTAGDFDARKVYTQMRAESASKDEGIKLALAYLTAKQQHENPLGLALANLAASPNTSSPDALADDLEQRRTALAAFGVSVSNDFDAQSDSGAKYSARDKTSRLYLRHFARALRGAGSVRTMFDALLKTAHGATQGNQRAAGALAAFEKELDGIQAAAQAYAQAIDKYHATKI